MMTRAHCCIAAALGMLVAQAGAAPYWITYEGNDFPENEGWTREYGDENGSGQGGAERWIEDGSLVLDGSRSSAIYDSYTMSRPVDPEPAEMFIMRWRFRIDHVSAHEDPIAGVFSDGSWAVAFQFSETRAISTFETNNAVDFEPGVFHQFELRSWDMRSYELGIDGSLALTGDFVHVFTASEIVWGDGAVGSASLSVWDYVEFGVVPEPASGLLLGFGLFGRRCAG
jgi:hypothetical protein